MNRFLVLALLLCSGLVAHAQRFAVTVANIAVLRANYNPSSVDTNVTVLGYYTANDQGGGNFTWVAGDTTTTNLGTVFSSTYPNAPVGRWKRQFSGAYNVRWFGAKGDGSTQTTYIQNAYDTVPKNSGGDLYFPPGNYNFNLAVIDRNMGLIFDSQIKEDAGSPVITSNIIKAADITLPIITIGDGTHSAKGWRIKGGTFIGDGAAGVLLRLRGGAYEGEMSGAQFYNAKTNVWIQGDGAQPCSGNKMYFSSCLAANVADSRGVYHGQPDSGTSYTTANEFIGWHWNSQTGIASGNTYIMELDASQVAITASYFDILTNCPALLFTQSAGVNIQQPLAKCANVVFDAGSVIVVGEENWGASPRISASIVGAYQYDGTFKTIALASPISSEKNQSPVMPGGQFAAPNMNGRVAFDRIGSTTNRYWNTVEANDSDPTIFQISATNGTMEVWGRTNITFATGSGTYTNKLVFIEPGMVSISNSWSSMPSFKVYGAGSGPYSDTGAPTVRIFSAIATNTVQSGLHLDSYQNTPAFGLSIDLGTMNSTNGDVTSRIINWGNINTNRATALQLQTHTTTNGVWYPGLWIGTNSWFGFGTTNPGTFFDVAGNGLIEGSVFGIRNVNYTWPASYGAGTTVLNNDGSGNLSWATAGTVSSFSVGTWSPFMTVANATTTPTLGAVDPGANRLMMWDDTDNAFVYVTPSTNLTYDHTLHSLSANSGVTTISIDATLTNALAITNPSSTPVIASVDPAANRVWMWDDTDNRWVAATFSTGSSYDHASHTWTFAGTTNVNTNAAITTLNTLTNTTQYFTTGTSGSDFNITTSGADTHVFNIPTSAAGVRGLLSSADFTTFSNKVNGASNLGTGYGVWYDVSGTTLRFNGITNGPSTSSGIAVSSNANNIIANLAINSLTTDSTPDFAADYVVTYDTSAGAHKKVLLSKLADGAETVGSGSDMIVLNGSVDGDGNQGYSYLSFGGGGGTSITLPSAGIYRVGYNIGVYSPSTTCTFTAQLTNTTSGGLVAGTFAASGSVSSGWGSVGQTKDITVSGATTLQLMINSTVAEAYSTTAIAISTNTVLRYLKL